MEVTKAKEIMSNNLKGIETLVETVRRLEEGQLILEGRIDRLKKYNAELRATIVQLSSSMYPIVDVDERDVQDNSNLEARKSGNRLTMDERVLTELSDTSVATAANDETDEFHDIPKEVILEILMNLDKNSLYCCRLVSKKLNEISNEVFIKLYPRHIQISKKEYEDEPELKLEVLSGLHSLLGKSDAPGVLMQGLYSGSCLMKEECLSIIQEFGHLLKTLNIEGCNIRFSLMQSILLEWCPNLEELRLDCYTQEETLDCSQDLDFKKTEFHSKINKLRRLIISTAYGAKLNFNLFTSIAKSSPDLKFFKIEGNGNELANQLVAQQLKNFPEITKRLEELWIDYTSYRDGEDKTNIILAFLDLELGPRLKSLTFEACQDFEYDNFSRLLNKLASELETLNLMLSNDDEEPQSTYKIHWKTALPKMPKLRVFKCIGDEYFHLTSIDFLEYMPNLERLILARRLDDYGDVENMSPGRVDELFSSSVKFKSHNLKELVLFGMITSDLTCMYISQKFSNLTKLYVSIGNISEDNSSVQWIENVFEGFGQMNNLTNLYIDFGDSYENQKLEVAFEKLVNLKNLRYLVFISYDVVDSNFVSALKSLLSKVDKLQCLRLINFLIKLSDSMELIDWLGKRRSTTRVEFCVNKNPRANLWFS